jgi:hypothetical protein
MMYSAALTDPERSHVFAIGAASFLTGPAMERPPLILSDTSAQAID